MKVLATLPFALKVGLLCLLAVPVLAWWQGHAPTTPDLTSIFVTPHPGHLLGTDSLGRDILSRLAAGFGFSLQVALSVWLLSAGIGILFGLAAGWWGGWWDRILMRLADIVLAFPGILLALALASLMQPGFTTIVLALGLTGWVTFARLTRVQIQALKTQPHVEAAQLCGTATPRLWIKNLLPNIAGPLIVESVFTLVAAIVAEAGLSFLGVGVAPPTASLGAMIREGTQYLLVAPHLVLAPTGLLLILIGVLTDFGELLRHKLNPTRLARD